MTAAFKSGPLELRPAELAEHLLRDTGQDAPCPIDPTSILDRLKLTALTIPFESNLPALRLALSSPPRALLDFRERLIAIDSALSEHRARFSVLHEIGHYVLPGHRHAFYLCDDHGLNDTTNLTYEAEANRLAADLLFKSRHFVQDANEAKPTAKTVKALATRYGASFEATARRMVEKNLRPVMLLVCDRDPATALAPAQAPTIWRTRYCVCSPSFRARYFPHLDGEVPADVATKLTASHRDIASSITTTIEVADPRDPRRPFKVEWFWNGWNVMGIVTP